MVAISNVDKVLKDVYLDVLSNHLNYKTNAFYNMIHRGSETVQGGYAVAIGRYGLNGGISCPDETSDLPKPGGNNYVKFKADLRNIYGTIEITDKVLRASSDSSNALVNVLNVEMEGLLEAAKFNFARMLFQRGEGKLTELDDQTGAATNQIIVTDTKNLIEGMIFDVIGATSGTKKLEGFTILSVDRANKKIKTQTIPAAAEIEEGDIITLQNSFNTEIYGLPYIFDADILSIYGTLRNGNHYLYPTTISADALTTDLMQSTMDTVEEVSGGNTNLIICSYDVRRAYFAHLAETRTNLDYMNLDGGFKALSYNGIPVVADRFAPDKQMYFVNTDDFKLYQLSDWSWIEGTTGKVLRQVSNKAAYTATLVKYANLICAKPIGQAVINFS
ncbi:MAG: phage major capsid protein [Clostridia bacterium]|nr:phage major capsid protein [Clostridia bacterium]